jgi:oligoendopeptidase F
MKRTLQTLAALALVLAATSATAQEGEKRYYEDRAEIPVERTWDLTDLYESVDAWNAAFEELDAMLPTMRGYEGRLAESPQVLAEALAMQFDIAERLDSIWVYSGQNKDVDSGNAAAQELYSRRASLAARVSEATAFVDPEIAQIEDETMKKWRKKKALKTYDHYLDDIIRQKAAIRSSEVEQVLAGASQLIGGPRDVYTNLTVADIVWPEVEGPEGELVTVSPSTYVGFVTSQDRELRRRASLAMFGKFGEYGNTLAGTYNASVQKDVWLARTRGFDTVIEHKLFSVNVPPTVLETLVSTVHDNLATLHRYAEFRRDALGLDSAHVYDFYVPLVTEAEREYTFEEAYEIAMAFWLETYGEEYAAVGQRAVDERWIDVYPNAGKRGGAYAWGTCSAHPYMLLNWTGALEDVFTLVHEMGHVIHTYLACQQQPYHMADYTLFVAEVASVASEALFMDYMLERADSDTQKMALYEKYLRNITGTFVRQVFFHEFEFKAHQMAEAGEALTADSLNTLYADQWQAYFGPAMELDEEYAAGWSRIPHFYRTYYVWVYATSFAAGQAIAERVRTEGDAGVQGYLDMLKLGGSVYPMDALAAAGVDMTDPEVIRTVMRKYDETLTGLQPLAEEGKKKVEEAVE